MSFNFSNRDRKLNKRREQGLGSRQEKKAKKLAKLDHTDHKRANFNKVRDQKRAWNLDNEDGLL